MPRRKNILRPCEFHATIPEDAKARLNLALFSEVEGKIPFGAQQAFLLDAIRLRYEWIGLDLGVYLPNLFLPGSLIKGPREVMDKLRDYLVWKDNDAHS